MLRKEITQIQLHGRFLNIKIKRGGAMERRKVMVVLSDFYEYVIYNNLDKDKSRLAHKLSQL